MLPKCLLCCLIAVTVGNPVKRQTVQNSFNATEGQFPWQLVLTSTASIHDCGAVLIEPTVALTAAHCMESLLPTYHVTGGQVNKEVASGNEVTLGVESFTVHPDFDVSAAGFPNDIAILKLSGGFDVDGPHIKAIEMASSDHGDFAGSVCTTSGWGWFDFTKPRPTTLQYQNISCITNSACEAAWDGITGAAINSGHVCVFENGKVECVGDGGGPMVCDGVLVGTSSWQLSTCNALFPIVHTRISHFKNWIDDNK